MFDERVMVLDDPSEIDQLPREGLELMKAFLSIVDRRLREEVIALARLHGARRVALGGRVGAGGRDADTI